MRLIDADAYSAEMKDRQDAAWKWRNEAIAEEDEVKLARAEGAYTAFTEAKLTMDKHIINPWHRVEEPPEVGQIVLTMDANEDMETATYDGEGFEDLYGLYYIKNVLYWMPLPEPPKEEEHGN